MTIEFAEGGIIGPADPSDDRLPFTVGGCENRFPPSADDLDLAVDARMAEIHKRLGLREASRFRGDDGLVHVKLVNDRERCSHGPDCLECSGWPDLEEP